jgi:hypothetical protein
MSQLAGGRRKPWPVWANKGGLVVQENQRQVAAHDTANNITNNYSNATTVTTTITTTDNSI